MKPSLSLNVKFTATLLIATWLLCWVHCFVEQNESAGGGCCTDRVTENHDQSTALSNPQHEMEKSVCVQSIFANGLKLSEKLEASPVIFTAFPANYFTSVFELAENTDELVADIPRPPPICFRLWEFMARTSLPVRGPTLIA